VTDVDMLSPQFGQGTFRVYTHGQPTPIAWVYRQSDADRDEYWVYSRADGGFVIPRSDGPPQNWTVAPAVIHQPNPDSFRNWVLQEHYSHYGTYTVASYRYSRAAWPP